MGLDMMARVVDERPDKDVDFEYGKDKSRLLFAWRKHPDLHGWMHELYKAKGGTDPDFNCNAMILESEDIDRLEKAVKDRKLPRTEGFFFGRSDDTDRDADLIFIDLARNAIENGGTVYYTSWW